jgi:hypothetical protein
MKSPAISYATLLIQQPSQQVGDARKLGHIHTTLATRRPFKIVCSVRECREAPD